jgi:hypothetical protein
MAFFPTVPDEQAFTVAVSPVTPVAGVFNDALATLSAGVSAELRITEKRAAHVNLRNEAGTELGTAAAPVRIDPTGTTTQPVSGTVLVSGTVAENLIQLAGTAVDVNSGNKSAGTLRVVLATDQPALTNAQPVTEASLDAAIGTPGAAAPAKAIETGGTDGTNLRTFLTDTTGRQKVLLYDAAGNALVVTAGRLVVDGSGVTQPVSAASLPLPTGASTAAKQPALGTAGTPSADVISVQGIASMTALKVDGSGVTGPVNLTQLVGTAVDVNSGTKSAGTQRVVLATDQPALTNALKVDGSAVTQPENLIQLAGTAVDVNSGTKSAGTLRIVLATDQPQLTNSLLVQDAADGAIGSAVPSKASFSGGTDGTNLRGFATDINGRLYTRQLLPIKIKNFTVNTTFPTAGSQQTVDTGAPGYAVFAIYCAIQGAAYITGSTFLTIVFNDSSSGAVWDSGSYTIPGASFTTTAIQPPFIAQTPPGFFYANSISNSVLRFYVSSGGAGFTAGTMNVFVYYSVLNALITI